MSMEQVVEYIKPELLVLIPALYFLGQSIKKSETVPNKYIPAVVNVLGVGLALLYVFGSVGMNATAMFTAIVQGILAAGAAVNWNEVKKQSYK